VLRVSEGRLQVPPRIINDLHHPIFIIIYLTLVHIV
jgi:hypothetical protein